MNIESILHEYTTSELIAGAVMFLGWGGAYAFIIHTCFKEKVYGLPMASICLNICWEFMFSFRIISSGEEPSLVWGNRLWFALDVVLITQLFLYGKKCQTNPFVKKYFYPIAVATLLLSGVGLYFFVIYTGDVYGTATSFLMDFVMSILFINLLFQRPRLRGLSYPAAWLMTFGTAAGAVFCYSWWPAQFADGKLAVPPHWPEPTNFGLLYFLYLTILVLNLMYVYLLGKRRRELREAGEIS